ncbi:MAG: HAMP domain-containing histidine kinase [Candidatus Diapherotrites archaeon]|nr:HAMP domain-containing histidine kinase [Candidatus Diapherotrites archaeon]
MAKGLGEIKSRISRIKTQWKSYKSNRRRPSAGKLARLCGETADRIGNYLKNREKYTPIRHRGTGSEFDLGAGIHDLRAPLNKIKGLAGLARDNIAIEGWEDGVEGGFDDIDNVLANYKKPFNPVETNLHGLLNKIVRNEKRMRIDLDIGALPQTAEVASHKIESLVKNIIDNAADNFKDNKIEDPFVHISGEKDNGYFVLHIRDNGTGVPKFMKDTLFNKYVTGREKGTGVGTHLVKQAVELHHPNADNVLREGHLWFEPANPGAEFPGTIFHIRIPLKYEPKPSLEDGPKP